MADLRRRDFFGRLAMWLSLGASLLTPAAFGVRFLYPKRVSSPRRSVFLSRLDELIEGSARAATDLRGLPLLVVREGQTVRALSTVCTHLGCRVRWEPDAERFFCPCHAGVFDREGRVVSGPPPRPLERYPVEIVSGNVFVSMKEPVA